MTFFSFLKFLFFNFCLFLLVCIKLFSHEIKPSVADIKIEENNFKVKINFNIEAILSDMDLSNINDTDTAENSNIYNQYRSKTPSQIKIILDNKINDILNNIYLNVDGKIIQLYFSKIDIEANKNLDVPRESIIFLETELPKNSLKYNISWNKKYGDLVIRDFSFDEVYSQYLKNGDVSNEINIKTSKKQSTYSTVTNYVKIGFLHIIPLGLDHILFIIGIYLVISNFKDLFIKISLFTFAHTLSFALSSLKIIVIPAFITEPLIALSITYVALENIFLKNSNFRRLSLIFFFGLMHGLGFSYMLSEFLIDYQSFIISMISFNVGVELGQLFVVLLCFLIFGYWFKSKEWYRRLLVIPLSSIMAIISLFWFFERITKI